MKYIFDTEIATKVGMNAAVIYENLVYWVTKNEANEKHFHNGYYWTYSSIKGFVTLFPFLSEKQIRTAIEKLEETGLIKSDNFNETSYDRTKWYAILPLKNHSPKKANGDEPKGQNHSPKKANGLAPQGKPIPYSKEDSNNIKEEPGGKAPDSLFPEIEVEKVDKSKKTLFSNSVYKDYDTFSLKFTSPEYERVDLFHYYTSVKNWSDKSDTKRTARGWIATAQDFMRGDIEKQKLKLKPEFQNTNQSQTPESMMEYLNSMQ